MYSSIDPRIFEADRYIAEFGWWLTVVRGDGDEPKAPLYRGWPDFQPKIEHLENVFSANRRLGLGINLGASNLIDLEADTDEGEAELDSLCRGIDFPYWTSRRGKHRLFQVPDKFGFLKIKSLGIEFRTGRHQSVLPPSVIGEDRVQYRWVVDPIDCTPPPLPKALIEFADVHRKDRNNVSESPYRRGEKRKTWPYRDNFDYVLRDHDLKEVAEEAGVEFVFRDPDGNGNLPCHVPEAIRPDHHPSGVFNVFNGVLRDFSTGINHLFFHTMSALTGRPWWDIFHEFEKSAKSTSGRPHSRRVSILVEPETLTDHTTIEDARQQLGGYYEEQLSRPARPKTLNIIKGPPGQGKTFGLCKTIAAYRKPAIILTQENKLAGRHRELLDDDGLGNARRMPILRETACPSPDDYDATVRRGFKPSQSLPCQRCPIGPRHCPYLLQFPNLNDATQLCAALIYHTHDDFCQSHGNEDRDILVFDENCVDSLLEPVSYTLAQWQAWGDMIQKCSEEHPKTKEAVDPLLGLLNWLGEIVNDFTMRTTESNSLSKFHPYPVPDEIKHGDLPKSKKLVRWLNSEAFSDRHRQVPNLYDAARYLLTASDTYVLLERFGNSPNSPVNVRFRKKNPLPEDKEVFILDATANEELLRAIAPDWDIRVWECQPIEQAGRIIQIMDYDLSRSKIERELRLHTEHNPSWAVQVLDNILEKNGPAAVISFKAVTRDGPDPKLDILSKLKHQDKISSRHNYPCRGHDFPEDTLIVLGTPYKDEAAIWELTLALWGIAGLPASNYEHREREHGCFVVKNMRYGEDRLRMIQDFLLSAELVQAIGRVRPLQNPSTVFVLSNAPIPDWEVEQFMASELFDMRQQIRRTDAAGRFNKFCQAVDSLLLSGDWISLKQIFEAAGDLSTRTVRRYWADYRQQNNGMLELNGRRVRLQKETDEGELLPVDGKF